MAYADSTDYSTLTTSIADSISASLKSLALEVADVWIDSKLESPITGTTPALVEKAATYKAYAYTLRNLYDTDLDDTPMADFWDKEADKLLNAYIGKHTSEESLAHPYSSSQTPTAKEAGKNVRTVYDYTNYDDIDDTKWTSE